MLRGPRLRRNLSIGRGLRRGIRLGRGRRFKRYLSIRVLSLGRGPSLRKMSKEIKSGKRTNTNDLIVTTGVILKKRSMC